jgi:hypothetical protein
VGENDASPIQSWLQFEHLVASFPVLRARLPHSVFMFQSTCFGYSMAHLICRRITASSGEVGKCKTIVKKENRSVCVSGTSITWSCKILHGRTRFEQLELDDLALAVLKNIFNFVLALTPPGGPG